MADSMIMVQTGKLNLVLTYKEKFNMLHSQKERILIKF